MPRVPKGERRPADATGNAVMIAKIATAEIEDITTERAVRTPPPSRLGGKARAEGMSATGYRPEHIWSFHRRPTVPLHHARRGAIRALRKDGTSLTARKGPCDIVPAFPADHGGSAR